MDRFAHSHACRFSLAACVLALGLGSGCGSDAINEGLDRDRNSQSGDGDDDLDDDADGDGDDGDGDDGDGDSSDGDGDSDDEGRGDDSGDGDTGDGDDAGDGDSDDAGTGDGDDEPGDSANACLKGISNFDTKGPFTFEKKKSGQVNLWVPKVEAGCKVPVVHLANGTTATCSAYGAILEHLASHGFLATCYEDPNTGQGTQCITALETAYKEYPDLADDKIGSTGHSQGGGAALVCVARAEEKWGKSKVIAGHAMEPAHGYGDAPPDYSTFYKKIISPIFMFNGSVDGLVSASWVQQGFDALNDSAEAYWYEATGAAHIPVPTKWTQQSATAWFRWKLLDDKKACEYFKALPDGDQWDFKKAQNDKGC